MAGLLDLERMKQELGALSPQDVQQITQGMQQQGMQRISQESNFGFPQRQQQPGSDLAQFAKPAQGGLLAGGGGPKQGLLGFIQDPKNAPMLLSAAASLLQSAGPSVRPVSLGQAVGGALQSSLKTSQQMQQLGIQKQLADARTASAGAAVRNANRPATPQPLVTLQRPNGEKVTVPRGSERQIALLAEGAVDVRSVNRTAFQNFTDRAGRVRAVQPGTGQAAQLANQGFVAAGSRSVNPDKPPSHTVNVRFKDGTTGLSLDGGDTLKDGTPVPADAEVFGLSGSRSDVGITSKEKVDARTQLRATQESLDTLGSLSRAARDDPRSINLWGKLASAVGGLVGNFSPGGEDVISEMLTGVSAEKLARTMSAARITIAQELSAITGDENRFTEPERIIAEKFVSALEASKSPAQTAAAVRFLIEIKLKSATRDGVTAGGNQLLPVSSPADIVAAGDELIDELAMPQGDAQRIILELREIQGLPPLTADEKREIARRISGAP